MHGCIGRLRCRYYVAKNRKNAEIAAAPFLFTVVCGIILHEVYSSQTRQIHAARRSTPFRDGVATHAIDVLEKMSLQANIFSSWYNIA